MDLKDLDAVVAAMPYATLLGIELENAAADEVRGRMTWSAERCTIGGIVHGGALMSFADTVGAVCAFLNLPDGTSTATIESKTNFFRAVRSGTVRSVSRPLHVGRTTIAIQTELFGDGDRRVAHVVQSQAVFPAGG